MEHLKQMRLIEESTHRRDAVRFMAKRKEHEERMRELAGERNSILDGMEANSRASPKRRASNGKRPGCSTRPEDVLEERRRYREEMLKFLSVDKFARMLILNVICDAGAERDGKNLKKRTSKFDE